MAAVLPSSDLVLANLVTSLSQAKSSLAGTDEDFGFLSNLLQSKELIALLQVHSAIVGSHDEQKSFPPVLGNMEDIVNDVLDEIEPIAARFLEVRELFLLLQQPHFQGLVHAHDGVAQKDYFPRLPDIPTEVDEDEETVKIVQLVKSSEPLGATIKADKATGRIVIARVMHGGAADRSGLIHVGDEVHEVNGISVAGKSPNDVLEILKNSEGTITFKLIPGDSKMTFHESRVRLKAHFDYNPLEDQYIPCKEAGLAFQNGDILHIVSHDDPYWWQARREGDLSMRSGLIPSRALQEKRILTERCPPPRDLFSACGVAQEKKVKQIMYDITENDDFDREEIATYEEVARLYPRPGLPRPIVLIGPEGVGRNELKRRLIALNPEKFRTTVPYTTRPRRSTELDGREYHFVEREFMESEIHAGKFLEFGEYKGNFYGTSTESVKSIMHNGCVCIMTPHYQALKMLRNPELKPYVIFIKPPPFEVLKETRLNAYAKSTHDPNNSRSFTDEELWEMLHTAERMEYVYAHWFDEVIVNDDLSKAFEKLIEAVGLVESEPLWVPISWVQ